MRLDVAIPTVALVALGIILVSTGMILGSQVAWQGGDSEVGPPNLTIPAGGAYTPGVLSGPLNFTQRVVAVWSASSQQMQFEVLILRPGTNPGVINSSDVGNATVVSRSDGVASADLTFSVNMANPYLLAYVLVNEGTTPVTVSSFAAFFEAPYYPNSQLGEYVQVAGYAIVVLAVCYVLATAVRSRRKGKSNVPAGSTPES